MSTIVPSLLCIRQFQPQQFGPLPRKSPTPPHKRWNDFQDEHEDLLEQLERLRTTFKLSNSSAITADPNNTTDATSTRGGIELVSPGCEAGNHGRETLQHERGVVGGDPDRGSRGGDSKGGGVRPISGRDGDAPPISMQHDVLQSSGSSRRNSTGSPRGEEGLRLRLAGNTGEGGTGNADRRKMPSSPRSSRRSSPRRLSSASCSSPRYTASPVAAAWASDCANQGAGLQRRHSKRELDDNDINSATGDNGLKNVEGVMLPAIGGSGGAVSVASAAASAAAVGGEERARVYCHSDGDWANATAAATVAANPTLLHASDSGGYYDDDFDDCLEDESEGENQHQQQEQQQHNRQLQENRNSRENPFVVTENETGEGGGGRVNGGSGVSYTAGGGVLRDNNTLSGDAGREREGVGEGLGQDVDTQKQNGSGAENDSTPLHEVVYRPPSGSSRGGGGKGERPKSAARQGRSASLNAGG